ncbi:hypothetical protein [Amycolatopsis lexingtonensis]|uniref:hypothetical protein n=1 Tax=Amycolatopsis lexingtonensis TaxID=218822 RepID=UPI003F727B50
MLIGMVMAKAVRDREAPGGRHPFPRRGPRRNGQQRLPPAAKEAAFDEVDREVVRGGSAGAAQRVRELLRDAGDLATAGAGLWTALAAVGVPL